MRAPLLIIVMILLQTGALSLGPIGGRRCIAAAVSLDRKSAHSILPRTGNRFCSCMRADRLCPVPLGKLTDDDWQRVTGKEAILARANS
jgi:hypothetical protein